ncbi:MAG: hypothetical protein H7066_17190 [Cytophagaceae bacterium]|nr:hypothetical protein [Gemmatimonadaceae bacterium]
MECVVDVVLRDVGASHPLISTLSHTVNVSESGLLIEVPNRLDACVGQEVVVTLTWPGGTFESEATIVRFESPYWRDGASSVMGLHVAQTLPSDLISMGTAS